jgi:hypothetical protein
MAKRPVILVVFLFALHAFATPWRPLGILKRAPEEEHQNDRRGGSFNAAYGGWSSNSETHGPQPSGWNTLSVTTTEECSETSTTYQQYSWKTTTAHASAITSPKKSMVHETTMKNKTSTVNGTHYETCSVVSTSTMTQQVPTTILSIVASQGSCTPAGAVIPPATVTQKETVTIFSTIAGTTIVSTQIVSATEKPTVLTYTQYSTAQCPSEIETVVSTQYQLSTVRSVYTETEWFAATATVKSTYTETETSTVYQGQTVTQTVVSTLSAITQTETCKSSASNSSSLV